LTYGSLKPRIF